MDTNKAAYWIVLGVLALGLNSEYQQGRFVALHRASEQAGSAFCRITARAEQTLALARMLGREEFSTDNLVTSTGGAEIARSQNELREQVRDEAERVRETVRQQIRDEIRAQSGVIRAQAEMRRAQIEQMRWRTRSQLSLARTADRRVTVVCPKTGQRIEVNDGQAFVNVVPELELEDSN